VVEAVFDDHVPVPEEVLDFTGAELFAVHDCLPKGTDAHAAGSGGDGDQATIQAWFPTLDKYYACCQMWQAWRKKQRILRY
jgi:hypothetical protein